MLYVMFSFFAIGVCAFAIMIFGLLKSGRHADELEDKILDIILPSEQPSYNIKKEKVDENIEEDMEAIQESEVLAYK